MHIKFSILNCIDSIKSAFSLASFLPKSQELKSFFRYPGSLTTEPYSEGLLWNVFITKIPISNRQVLNFCLLKNIL